jgi:hypothetical protein
MLARQLRVSTSGLSQTPRQAQRNRHASGKRTRKPRQGSVQSAACASLVEGLAQDMSGLLTRAEERTTFVILAPSRPKQFDASAAGGPVMAPPLPDTVEIALASLSSPADSVLESRTTELGRALVAHARGRPEASRFPRTDHWTNTKSFVTCRIESLCIAKSRNRLRRLTKPDRGARLAADGTKQIKIRGFVTAARGNGQYKNVTLALLCATFSTAANAAPALCVMHQILYALCQAPQRLSSLHFAGLPMLLCSSPGNRHLPEL